MVLKQDVASMNVRLSLVQHDESCSHRNKLLIILFPSLVFFMCETVSASERVEEETRRIRTPAFDIVTHQSQIPVLLHVKVAPLSLGPK